MLAPVRSPWFSVALAVLFAVLAVFIEGHRLELLGLAGTAAFWSIVEFVNRVFDGDAD
jgi:hypothetical protein